MTQRLFTKSHSTRNVDSQTLSKLNEIISQSLRLTDRLYLGTPSRRYIYDHVRCTDSLLLAHDRRKKHWVYGQRILNLDENIIRWSQFQSTAPNHAPIRLFNDFSDLVNRQVNWTQRFNAVSRP